MGYIYKIINLKNQKIYIGKTTTCIRDRFSQHKYEAQNPSCKGYNFILHRAFRKYGINNFKLELIEENSNEILSEREKYWINYYNSLIPNGYNMTFGGEGSIKINYDEVFTEWDNGKSIPEIAKKLKCSVDSLRKILPQKENYSPEENLKRVINSTKKPVGKYNKNNDLLEIYDSIKTAAESVSVDRSCISRCCSGKKKSSRGYIWKFIDIDHLATGRISAEEAEKIYG